MAVFLVLYYVLVMQPREQARYDEMRESIERLISVVEKGQTLLTKNQARNIEMLYVVAVANEIGPTLHDEFIKDTTTEHTEEMVCRIMRKRTELLEGLSKKDGSNVSAHIAHRIADPNGVCKWVAIEAKGWKGATPQEISRYAKNVLDEAFSLVRMFK